MSIIGPSGGPEFPVSSVGGGAVVGAALVCSSAVAVASPVGVEHPATIVAIATKRTIEEAVITVLARLVGNGDMKLIVNRLPLDTHSTAHEREWFPTS
ncbi:MAG: hypothetical protein GY788_32425 [bacterium]|nr:hypothetical protein [bacterium]